MEEKYMNTIINGVTAKGFPKIPVDYGYRDNTHFWYSPTAKYIKEPIPAMKEVDISTVRYAADRIDPNIHFTDEACKMLVRVPRIFLKMALEGCAKWARENDVTEISEKEMEIINDKRSKEKKRK